MRTLLASLLALALLYGCDIVDMPRGEQSGPVNPGSGVTRRVLLEDCTGHLCPNCPAAAVIAEQLKDVYGDRLVIVAVHMSSTFAAPQAPIGDGIYDDDFRTPAGNQYESMFQVDGLPKGLIDRTPYNNLVPIPRNNWSSAVAQLIDQPADLDLWIDSLSYNTSSNTVAGTVKAAVLNAIPGPQNLTIYLTESHIIGWQENGTENIPDYEFNHLLRAALNNPLGESFISADAQVGDTLVNTFSYVLPANVLVPNNCSLVAYVHNTNAGPEQYQVQQATERKFVP